MQKDLMTTPGVPASLDNHIGVTFKEGDHFFTAGDLLSPDHPAHGLLQDPFEQRYRLCQLSSRIWAAMVSIQVRPHKALSGASR